MGELSPWHWAVVILVLALLFGAKRLPDAARGIGRSARILKAELHGPEPEESAPPAPAAPESERVPPVAPTTADPMITTSQTPPRRD